MPTNLLRAPRVLDPARGSGRSAGESTTEIDSGRDGRSLIIMSLALSQALHSREVGSGFRLVAVRNATIVISMIFIAMQF